MLSRRIVAARPLVRALVPATARLQPQFTQIRTALTAAEHAELADPNQNGGYINPAPEKRGKRDPYADYWDQQERRNYGEPCHEDHDILGVMSLHDYDHFKPGWGFVLLGTFVVSVFTLMGAVSMVYPDKKSAPRTYPDGLEVELGGKRALLVSGHEMYGMYLLTARLGKEARRGMVDRSGITEFYVNTTELELSVTSSTTSFDLREMTWVGQGYRPPLSKRQPSLDIRLTKLSLWALQTSNMIVVTKIGIVRVGSPNCKRRPWSLLPFVPI
jgi:NADH dehydrogenase (ubiquinone) 1 beta subcomplex subunit 8